MGDPLLILTDLQRKLTSQRDGTTGQADPRSGSLPHRCPIIRTRRRRTMGRRCSGTQEPASLRSGSLLRRYPIIRTHQQRTAANCRSGTQEPADLRRSCLSDPCIIRISRQRRTAVDQGSAAQYRRLGPEGQHPLNQICLSSRWAEAEEWNRRAAMKKTDVHRLLPRLP